VVGELLTLARVFAMAIVSHTPFVFIISIQPLAAELNGIETYFYSTEKCALDARYSFRRSWACTIGKNRGVGRRALLFAENNRSGPCWPSADFT